MKTDTKYKHALSQLCKKLHACNNLQQNNSTIIVYLYIIECLIAIITNLLVRNPMPVDEY